MSTAAVKGRSVLSGCSTRSRSRREAGCRPNQLVILLEDGLVLRFHRPRVGGVKAPRHSWIILCSILFTKDRTNKLRIGALGDSWHRYEWEVHTCPACSGRTSVYGAEFSMLAVTMPSSRESFACLHVHVCAGTCLRVYVCTCAWVCVCMLTALNTSIHPRELEGKKKTEPKTSILTGNKMQEQLSKSVIEIVTLKESLPPRVFPEKGSSGTVHLFSQLSPWGSSQSKGYFSKENVGVCSHLYPSL